VAGLDLRARRDEALEVPESPRGGRRAPVRHAEEYSRVGVLRAKLQRALAARIASAKPSSS